MTAGGRNAMLQRGLLCMMGDLLIGVGMIGAGVTGLIFLRHMVNTLIPDVNRERAELAKMSPVELHADLTRCMGAIMVCSRKCDRRGVRHTIRRIWLVAETMIHRAERQRNGGIEC